MKSLKPRAIAIGSVLLLTGGLTFAGAAAANATDVSYGCGLVRGLHSPFSASTYKAAGNCGTMGVQAHYSHVGGSSWTNWVYDGSLAVRDASNTFGGNHSSVGGGTFPS